MPDAFEHGEWRWDFTQRFLAAPADEALACWQWPGIGVRGWIPFAAEARELPPCTFRDAWPSGLEEMTRETLSIHELLRSGNDRPRGLFGGPGDFQQSLNLKDFRCMLAIDQPRLYCAPDGTPRLFTCWRAHRVGFTPLRAGNGTWHSPGEETACQLVATAGGNVTFDYWLRFRLSEFVDFLGTLLSGYPAPFAIVRIRLTMRPSGDAQVSFNSSFLPSQEFYVDWKSAGEYDMLACSGQDFWNFIKAGERRNAPTEERFQAELKAQVIHLRELR